MILPGTCIRVRDQGRKAGNQMWEFSLLVPDDLDQMVDLRHPQWVSHADTQQVPRVKVGIEITKIRPTLLSQV